MFAVEGECSGGRCHNFKNGKETSEVTDRRSCQVRGKLVCRETTARSTDRITFLAGYFVRCTVHALLSKGRSIRVRDFVKFSNQNLKTLNEVKLIKV